MDNVFELGVIRPISNSTVANSIVDVDSINSTMAVESLTNNVNTNTITPLIDSAVTQPINQSYLHYQDSIQSVNINSTPIHRRIIIIYFIGVVMFIGLNAVVATYIFVSSSYIPF